MALIAAEKRKSYRETLKKKALHQTMKAENRERMKVARSKLSDFQLEQYRRHDAAVQENARAAKDCQSEYVVFKHLTYVKHVNSFIPLVDHSVRSKVLGKLSRK